MQKLRAIKETMGRAENLGQESSECLPKNVYGLRNIW